MSYFIQQGHDIGLAPLVALFLKPLRNVRRIWLLRIPYGCVSSTITLIDDIDFWFCPRDVSASRLRYCCLCD